MHGPHRQPAAGFFFGSTLAKCCFHSSKPLPHVVNNSFTNWKLSPQSATSARCPETSSSESLAVRNEMKREVPCSRAIQVRHSDRNSAILKRFFQLRPKFIALDSRFLKRFQLVRESRLLLIVIQQQRLQGAPSARSRICWRWWMR